jgi:hypothetical protein
MIIESWIFFPFYDPIGNPFLSWGKYVSVKYRCKGINIRILGFMVWVVKNDNSS